MATMEWISVHQMLTCRTAGATRSNAKSDLILDSLASGVLGGAIVALFFLFMDLLDGRPLFTPSLLGSVLFHGIAAEAVTQVQLDAVVYFSILHIVAFAALGAAISLLVHEVELHARHPAVVLLVILAILEMGFFLMAPVAPSGVIARLGIVRLGVANLLAAGTMALFFVLSHRARAWKKFKHTRGDLIFDSFCSGAIGGSAVGLFFLVIDFLDGQPLFTPSLLGSVLFHGVGVEDVTQVRLDAVVYFSIAHIAAFVALGAAISFLVHEAELHSRHPVEVLLVLLAILEVGFFLVASLAFPGLIARLGIVRVGVANLLAAGSMALFFVLSHRAKAWHRFELGPADLLFDSFYAGGIGGSVVGIFFLLVDLLDGQPFFTPSLMGSVLFLGIAAEDVAGVHLDAVAYYTIVHMVGFMGLGAAITWLVHEVELHSRHPAVVLLVLFAILEAGFLVVASLVLPGVIARVGIVPVGVANVLAAGTIALFFVWSHRPGRRVAEEIIANDGLG